MGAISFWQKLKSFFTKTHTKPTLSGVPISKRITRRQDFPDAHIPDGSIYILKTENLKRGSIYGDKVMLLETEGTLNINEPSDWILAEEQIKK
jgi:CMP-N-acetylneuraminic acid synthetase